MHSIQKAERNQANKYLKRMRNRGDMRATKPKKAINQVYQHIVKFCLVTFRYVVPLSSAP